MDIDSNFVADRLEDLLSIVIVSSPCSSHPETTLIEKAIRSLSKFTGLDKCPIVIVLDGFVVRETARTKKGQITDSMSKQYDAYHHRLLALYGNSSQVQIKRSEDHLGFAMAVKFGLSFCSTTYGMVAQHDRVFVHSFHRLLDLIKLMEENEHMRYIGFPTIANRTHDSVLNSRYQISYLDSSEVKLNLGENLYLQPLIFWFDSQHLCHIRRYIEIYKPYAALPEEMRNWLGKKTINKMVLRNGDFIEDRFGQSQRNCLTAKGKSDSFMLSAFRWFGSYLAWIPDDKAKVSRDGRGACVMVGHLRGRQLDPLKIEIYRADVSQRLLRRKECSEGYEANPDGIDDCQKLFEASDDADADCLKGEVDEGDLNRHRTRPHGAEGQGLKKGYFSEIEYSSDGEGDDVQGKRYTDIATCQDDMSTGGDIDLGNISDGDVDDDDDADGTDESGRLSRSAESVCDLSCHLVKVSV